MANFEVGIPAGRKELFTTNSRYQEILRLDAMLKEKQIPHLLQTMFDGWQIIYEVDGIVVADAIEHLWSYGGRDDDKLEIMGLLTPEEEQHDMVAGGLTAEDVCARIEKHWREHNGEGVARVKPYDMNFPELSEDDIQEIRKHTAVIDPAVERRLKSAAQMEWFRDDAEREKAASGLADVFKMFNDAFSARGSDVIRTTMRQLKTDWTPCGACDTRDYTSCPSCRYLGRSLDDTPCCDCSPSGKCGKSYYEPAAFCSHCGRPLTEEAWAALEKILKGDSKE